MTCETDQKRKNGQGYTAYVKVDFAKAHQLTGTCVGAELSVLKTGCGNCSTFATKKELEAFKATMLKTMETVLQASLKATNKESCKDLPDLAKQDGVYKLSVDGKEINAYCYRGWTLFGNFSKNAFCYRSGRWGDKNTPDLNIANLSSKASQNIDAVGQFFKRGKSKKLRFTSQYSHQNYYSYKYDKNDVNKQGVIVEFEAENTPQVLMGAKTSPMKKPINYDAWRRTFSNGVGRLRQPVFQRAGVNEDNVLLISSISKFSTSPRRCRKAGQGISGCGKPCKFCFQQSDGHSCDGGNKGANDVSIGLGLNKDYCGGGDANVCSSGGHWGNRIVYAQGWAW